MLLSKNEHNVKNTHMEDWNVTKPGFVECFKTPTIGSKDGSYFLMGHCAESKRTTQNMKEANLIILDCDSRLDENLNVVDGAPPVEQACNVLKEEPWSCLLYTTFSHRKDYPRYRIVFFPDVPVKPKDVEAVTKAMFEEFNKAGVSLAYTRESSRISQPWFFPRVKDKGQEYICKIKLKGEELQIEKILSEVPKEKKLKKLKNLRGTPDGTWSPIDMFLQTNTLEYIDALLEKHGYEKKYATTDGFKYLAPGSTSGKPGVWLFKGRKGKWRVSSYHGQYDLLAVVDIETKTPRALDAYDVLVMLEYKGDYKEASKQLVEQHHERLQKHFLDRFVYRAKSDMVGDRQTGKSYTSGKHFNNFAASAFWIAASGDPTKTGKKISASSSWMSSGERITATGDSWKPIKVRTYLDENDKDINDLPQLHWNIYSAPKWDEIKSEDYLHFFIDHIKYLIPDKDDCELFIQWLAERFQYPEKRALFTPLHISLVEGTGRGWLVKVMGKLLGVNNCSSVTMRALASQDGFNEYLSNTRFCAIHEVYEKGKDKYQINDRVKTLLTEDRLLIDHKFGSKGDKQIYTSIFMMSNHKDCLVVPKGDRRLFVIECDVRKKSPTYYKKLDKLRNNEQFLREVFWYLKRLDITWIRNMSEAPENSAKARLVGAVVSDTEARFNEMLDNPPGLVWTNLLMQTYINYLKGREFPAANGRADPEIETLCRNELRDARDYNTIQLSSIIPTGRNTLMGTAKSARLRVCSNFTKELRDDAPALMKGLKKTIDAINRLLAEPTD